MLFKKLIPRKLADVLPYMLSYKMIFPPNFEAPKSLYTKNKLQTYNHMNIKCHSTLGLCLQTEVRQLVTCSYVSSEYIVTGRHIAFS